MNRQFPRLEVSRSRLRHNMEEVISRCTAQGIQVCGVIKGCSGLPEVGQLFRDCGATQLASSRLEQIIRCRQAGVPGPYMLLRIPMLCELDDVARWCDYSLESERATLDALEEACARQGAVHKAVIMADLGDLREGFWDQDEMLDVCVHVERDLPHVELAGVGVNLGTMPEGINHLRIGEGILVSKDLQVDWGIHDMDYLRMDCMTLRAQIVEVKDKPTHPVGPIVVDCFCNRPTYEDRGIRRRAIAGIGRADVGDVMMLRPRTPGMTVVGGSSDHCILDVEDCHPCPRVGDVVDFDVIYLTMLYASAREDVPVVFVD